ncbi:MAG: HEPN domain-containing protein [archaeon]
MVWQEDESFRKWIEKSDSDMKIAKYNLDGSMLDAAVFFAQQSAEKAFKAILIKKSSQFPKIHDLIELAKLAGAPSEIIKLCSLINPVYTAIRYPDNGGVYSAEECNKIVEFAEEVLKWVKKNL